MKILYLCSDAGVPVLGRKGSSVHVRSLIAALSRAGHQVILAAPVLNKSPWETPAAVAATLLQVKPTPEVQTALQSLKEFTQLLGLNNGLPGELRRILYNKDFTSELKRRFAADPPDFIYERCSLFGAAGAILSAEWHVPLLLEINAPLALEQAEYREGELSALAGVAERWILAQADSVLAVSGPLRDYILSLGVAPDKVHIVPNGIDPALFQPGSPDPEARLRLGLGAGPVLGFVGGLRPWHGVEVLPELLGRLVSRHANVKLVLAGEGPLRGPLEETLRQRGLLEHVVFTGALLHEEVPAIVRQFDIALAPYPKLDHLFYFSPLKIFEYMACGVAVVAANCGQIAEVIRDGETGLLHPAGDLEAMTTACDQLLSRPKQRVSLGRAAARFIQQEYTWRHNAERVVDLARKLILAKTPAHPTRAQP